MSSHSTRHALGHRDLSVTYFDMEDAPRSLVAAVVEPLLWIVPAACRAVSVTIVAQQGDAMASVVVEDDYRQASIELDPHWFNCTPEGQRRIVAHELIHILLQPMGGLGRRLARTLPDSPARDLLITEWTRAVEMVTNDLDRTLMHEIARSQEGTDG